MIYTINKLHVSLKTVGKKIYNCILFYNIHNQLGSSRPSWKKNNKNLKCFDNSILRGMPLSLSYTCLMSPFTLHRQHGLQTASEPTNIRKEKLTTASYFIIEYTVLSLLYLCLMSFLPYTVNTA